MNKINWDNIPIVDFINVKENEIDNLPNGVSISTMCSSCNLNTIINILNIEKYLELDTNDVLCVKRNIEKIRTLIPDKKKNKRDKVKAQKSTNHFYNQITIIMRIGNGPINDWETEPKINLKLFKNGSVQMSGCKSVNGINIVLNKLLYKLKMVKAKIEEGKIVEISYVEDLSKINIIKFKIDMINSNYKVNMQIDRPKLFNLLIKKKIKSSYEPCIRACVIIKYTPNVDNDEQKEISVFIFQKGNIIITGARRKSHILSAYKYMNNILLTHSDEICKKDEKYEEDIILNLYNEVLKDIDNGLITL